MQCILKYKKAYLSQRIIIRNHSKCKNNTVVSIYISHAHIQRGIHPDWLCACTTSSKHWIRKCTGNSGCAHTPFHTEPEGNVYRGLNPLPKYCRQCSNSLRECGTDWLKFASGESEVGRPKLALLCLNEWSPTGVTTKTADLSFKMIL
jgi:hypothetical protein